MNEIWNKIQLIVLIILIIVIVIVIISLKFNSNKCVSNPLTYSASYYLSNTDAKNVFGMLFLETQHGSIETITFNTKKSYWSKREQLNYKPKSVPLNFSNNLSNLNYR